MIEGECACGWWSTHELLPLQNIRLVCCVEAMNNDHILHIRVSMHGISPNLMHPSYHHKYIAVMAAAGSSTTFFLPRGSKK